MKRFASTYLLHVSLAAQVHNESKLKIMDAHSNKGITIAKDQHLEYFLRHDTAQLAETFTCDSSIERWTHESNKKAAFDAAFASDSEWTDPTFKHDKTMLYWTQYPNKDPGNDDLDKINGYKSPPELDRSRETKFYGIYDGPKPTGIKQNQLGDCWFLAAAAAVAEVPGRFDALIDKKNRESDYNKAGIFRFYFYVKSEKTGINVDHKLPVYYGRYPYGSIKSSGHAWWLPLMEKAFAKLNQNYDRIQGGSGHESLRALTNKPVFRFGHQEMKKDMEKSWKTIHDLLYHKNYPAVGGCCVPPTAPHGLVIYHAYTLLGTLELKDGATTHRLAKLRNPWANEKYTGPWSDGSSEWTEEFKTQAGLTEKNDGTFYMPFELYMEHFFSTSVAIYEDFGYEHYWGTFSQTEKEKYFVIDNPVKQKFFVTVEVLSPRLKPYTCEKKNTINIYIYKDRKQLYDQVGFIGSLMYHDTIGDYFYKDQLDAGKYYLVVINWGMDEKPQIDYIVHVAQESSDKHITLDGESGKKIDTESFSKEDHSFDPESPTPHDDKERKKHDNLMEWWPDNPFSKDAMGYFTAHAAAMFALVALTY